MVLDDRVVPAPCSVEPVRKERVIVSPAQFDVYVSIYEENAEAVNEFVHRLGSEAMDVEHPEFSIWRVRRARVLSIGKRWSSRDVLGRPVRLLSMRLVEA